MSNANPSTRHRIDQQGLHPRPDGRPLNAIRPPQITFDGLARVDGSARFSFGPTGPIALASISGPIEVRLAAEQPSQATFEVFVRPLSNVPGTPAKALASVVRGALVPGLLLGRNPRTLVQMVVQVLVSAPGSAIGNDSSKRQDGGKESGEQGIVAAVINAGTLALLNAGSVPMRGVVCAVSAGQRRADGAVVVDPKEDEDLTAAGCFAYLIGGSEERAVWVSWKAIGGKESKVDEEGLEKAGVLAKEAAREVYEAMKRAVEGVVRIGMPGANTDVGDDGGDEDDDNKMEI